jgi:hypothetical protein
VSDDIRVYREVISLLTAPGVGPSTYEAAVEILRDLRIKRLGRLPRNAIPP